MWPSRPETAGSGGGSQRDLTLGGGAAERWRHGWASIAPASATTAPRDDCAQGRRRPASAAPAPRIGGDCVQHRRQVGPARRRDSCVLDPAAHFGGRGRFGLERDRGVGGAADSAVRRVRQGGRAAEFGAAAGVQWYAGPPAAGTSLVRRPGAGNTVQRLRVAISSGVRRSAAAATFSVTWSGSPVPGMASTCGPRPSVHASRTWAGVAS